MTSTVNVRKQLSRLHIRNTGKYFPLIVTVCLLLIMTGAAFFALQGWENQRFISNFKTHSNHLTDGLEKTIDGHFEILYSVQRLYQSSLDVSRQDFSSFVNSHLVQHTCIESLAWVPRLAGFRRIPFEAKAWADGYTDFQFTEMDGTNEVVTALKRDEYYPVYYVEPYEGNELFLGLDIASSPLLFDYLQQSGETGEITATPLMPIIQEEGNLSGIYIFVPVYYVTSDISTIEGRQEGLEGFALGIFRIDEIVSAFLNEGIYDNLEIELYDNTVPTDEQLLFKSDSISDSEENITTSLRGGTNNEDRILETTGISIAGRQWALIIYPSSEYLSTANTWYPWAVLAFGLILICVVGYALIVRIKHTSNIEKMANELSESINELHEEVIHRRLTEAELRASEKKYSQLVEQANDGIRIIQDGLIVFTNSKMQEMTGFSQEEYEGKHFNDFVAPEYREIVSERYHQRIAGSGALESYEIAILAKDGREIPVDINASVIEYNGRTADMAIVRDITERKKAEEMMAEEAARRHILVDGSTDGIVVLDEAGNVVEANRKFAEMLGYSYQEAHQLSVWDWEYQHSPEVTLEMIRSVDEKGDHFESRHRRKDGSIIDVEISTNAAIFSGKKIIFCVCRDITDRKREERLKQEETHILTLLGQGSDLQDVLDAIVHLGEEIESSIKGTILRYDNSTGKLYFSSGPNLPDALVEKLTKGLPTGPDTGSCGSAAYLKELVIISDITDSTNGNDNAENLKVLTDNGFFACWSQPIISTGGELLGIISNYSNKSGTPDEKALQVLEWSARIAAIAIEHKMAEESLKLSEETFSKVFYANPMPMFISTYNEKIISDINTAFENFSGFTREDCIGKTIDELNTLADKRDESRIIRSLAGSSKIENIEITMRIKSGEIRNVLISSEPIILNGKFYSITTHRDITRQKQMEKEKEEAEQKAYLSSRLAAVGQMAAGVAHEINNPLTGVLGFTDLLLARKDIPDDIRKDLEVIGEGAQRVSKIVRGMLTFSRNDRAEWSPVDINEIIRTTLSLRSYKMTTDDIHIVLSLDNNLPIIMASAGQLQQVFLNLLINAEQAVKPSQTGVKLNISTKRTGDIIRIKFKDNGVGISEEDIGKVFEPFFTTKEPGEGTGLGLSLCYGIIREHGGQMYVTSTRGKGATFTIELPVNPVDSRQPSQPESGLKENKVAKSRILVVDDESVVRSYLERTLQKEGHIVDTVDNATEALRIIPSNDYDLILMDIKMPEMSGIELYRRITEQDSDMARKIVFITGDILAADTKAFFKKYNPAYISKPIDTNHLRNEISRLLGSKTRVDATSGNGVNFTTVDTTDEVR